MYEGPEKMKIPQNTTERAQNALKWILYQLDIFRRQMSPFYSFMGGGAERGQCHLFYWFLIAGLPLEPLSRISFAIECM